MDRKITLRNGKREYRTQETQELTKEEKDQMMQMLIKMHEIMDGMHTDMKKWNNKWSEDRKSDRMEEDFNRVGGNIDDNMDSMVQETDEQNKMNVNINDKIDTMKEEIKGDINNITGNMDRLEKKIEEVNMETLNEIKKIRDENEQLSEQMADMRVDMVEQNKNLKTDQEIGVRMKQEFEKQVVEEIQELDRCLEENLSGAIQVELNKQNKNIIEEIQSIKIQSSIQIKEVEKEIEEIQAIKVQRQTRDDMLHIDLKNLGSEEVMQMYEENIYWKIKYLDSNTEKQIVAYGKRKNNYNSGIKLNWELEEMNKILQETMEEIEETTRQIEERIIYAENFQMRVKLSRYIRIIDPRMFNRTIKNEMIGSENIMGNKIIKRRNNNLKELETQNFMNLLEEINEIWGNEFEKNIVENLIEFRKPKENQTIREENKTKFRKRK